MTLYALRYVETALEHAEALADEAEDLEVIDLARRLRKQAADIAVDYDAAARSLDELARLRDARERAHNALGAVYVDGTLQLERLLPADVAAALSPGGHVEVAERARFRLRKLPDDERLADLRAAHERALFVYDAELDAFLAGYASSSTKRERAVAKSQALRLELERAKHTLLKKADPRSDAWKRIRRRCVRTKRARWLDEARVRDLLVPPLTKPAA